RVPGDAEPRWPVRPQRQGPRAEQAHRTGRGLAPRARRAHGVRAPARRVRRDTRHALRREPHAPGGRRARHAVPPAVIDWDTGVALAEWGERLRDDEIAAARALARRTRAEQGLPGRVVPDWPPDPPAGH